MVTVGVMMSLEDPQADRGKEKTMKLNKREAETVKECAISVQDAGKDERRVEGEGELDTMSCRVKVKGM